MNTRERETAASNTLSYGGVFSFSEFFLFEEMPKFYVMAFDRNDKSHVAYLNFLENKNFP